MLAKSNRLALGDFTVNPKRLAIFVQNVLEDATSANQKHNSSSSEPVFTILEEGQLVNRATSCRLSDIKA